MTERIQKQADEKYPAEILEAIDVIITKCPHAVFGGSIALNAVGLINRAVSDIDLFFGYTESLQKNEFLSFVDSITSDTVTDMNGNEIQRTGAKIKDVKVCVFKVSDEELQHSVINVCGRKLRIQNVNYAIIAKRTYADKNGKHKKDLKEIAVNLESESERYKEVVECLELAEMELKAMYKRVGVLSSNVLEKIQSALNKLKENQ